MPAALSCRLRLKFCGRVDGAYIAGGVASAACRLQIGLHVLADVLAICAPFMSHRATMRGALRSGCHLGVYALSILANDIFRCAYVRLFHKFGGGALVSWEAASRFAQALTREGRGR